MGHGKETPRQKMIGMMYLVLTALLALNVSKEVLDAFVIVDDGMNKTIKNFVKKNKSVYATFDEQYAINQARVGKLYDEVQVVKAKSDELYEFIQDLKIEIVKKSEGEETEAIKEREIVGDEIGGKDNTDIPAEIMVGDNNDKAGKQLREKMEEYREHLLELVDDDFVSLEESLEEGLDTHDHKDDEGVTHSWESEHFEHLPLISVLTIMTGLQANIRNAESDVINYLLTQVDAGSFKFNKLEPVVIPNSNYILKGNVYDARVFLAAFDTTQTPTVLVGDYETYEESGVINYRMKGAYDSLSVDETGKGIYQRPGNRLGSYKWGGLIRLQRPDGGYIVKPFETEYQVSEGSVTVSPTKMNVFYLGVDNPVQIAVSGIPDSKVTARITNGKISRGPNYVVQPRRLGNCMIIVSAEIDGKTKELDTKEFRVKAVPDPVAKVAGKKGGYIAKNTLIAQSGVQADMEDFDFDLQFKVIEFVVSATIKGFVSAIPTKGNQFTQDQKNLIQGMNRGEKVYIESIKAMGPDGVPRDLSTITLIIN